jgi:hypothetical protein
MDREDHCPVVIASQSDKAFYHVIGIIGVEALKGN